MTDKKYILIVGASSGIGAATAKAVSNQDTSLILMARRKNQLQNVQRELSGESTVVACDVCDYDQINDFFDSLVEKGIKLSALIYTAGICFVKPIKAMSSKDLSDMFAVNVFGFYEMCRHFQNSKVSEKGASIVALSSYASVTKEKGMSAYAMTKSAMNTAVQVMAKEFVKRQIRVNAILPANTTSIMGHDVDEWDETVVNDIVNKQALGLIPVEEVVASIRFLLSEDASHITGELLTITANYNGGK